MNDYVKSYSCPNFNTKTIPNNDVISDRVKFIKTNVIFKYHTKVVSKTLYDNRITKPKVIHAQIPVPKWGKIKWEKFFWKQNGAIRGLQIGIGFRDYKSGQEKLQIGTALRISNRGRDFKSSQRDFKSRQRLQIWGKGDFYSGQRLQTGAK